MYASRTTQFVSEVIDNSNSTLQYSGEWKSHFDYQIPSKAAPKNYMQTSQNGSSVALTFTGAAVAINAPVNWGHWVYSVVSTRHYSSIVADHRCPRYLAPRWCYSTVQRKHVLAGGRFSAVLPKWPGPHQRARDQADQLRRCRNGHGFERLYSVYPSEHD